MWEEGRRGAAWDDQTAVLFLQDSQVCEEMLLTVDEAECWRCACRAFKYTRREGEGRDSGGGVDCKHTQLARELIHLSQDSTSPHRCHRCIIATATTTSLPRPPPPPHSARPLAVPREIGHVDTCKRDVYARHQ